MCLRKVLFRLGCACALTVLLGAAAQAQSAIAKLQNTGGAEIGTVELTQIPDGVLLKLAVKGLPPGDHAFHIHAAGKCEPPFESAGGHFNPTGQAHGILAGKGHAGDMPNLHVPANGELAVEVIDTAVTLEKGKPNSLLQQAGTSIIIHAAKDDYKTDPAGNAGGRIACGIIIEGGTTTATPSSPPPRG